MPELSKKNSLRTKFATADVLKRSIVKDIVRK